MHLFTLERLVFMGDSAVDITNNPLAIKGLEILFEPVDSPGQDFDTTKDSTPQDIATAQITPGQDSEVLWTVDEAAAHLGISSKTVLRRLQKGTLKGHKVAGQFGLEWRVAQDTPGQIANPAQDKSGQDTIEIVRLKTTVELMSAEMKELKQQLQGASYRNGYLEAQLEGREHEIKLLTDSQHKRGWFARFASWFVTGR
jgi:excisionase family DNA binding protein